MQSYQQTDIKLHYLSQYIAKMNRQFLSKSKDDSHTNFYFDPLQKALISQWLPSQKGPILFRLNLNHWSFEFLNQGFNLLQSIDLHDHRKMELEKSIIKVLNQLEIKSDGYDKALHFQIPEYNLSEDFCQKTHPGELEEWMTYRTLANHACYQILGSIQKQGSVRIWPHHFDTAIHVNLSLSVSLGFGLAMADNYCNGPYFYASAYDAKGQALAINRSDYKLAAGYWIDEEIFKAAVLELKDLKDSEGELLHDYICAVLKCYLLQA